MWCVYLLIRFHETSWNYIAGYRIGQGGKNIYWLGTALAFWEWETMHRHVDTYKFWCAGTTRVYFKYQWPLWLEYCLSSLILESNSVVNASQTENFLQSASVNCVHAYYSLLMQVSIEVLCSLYRKSIICMSYLYSCDL